MDLRAEGIRNALLIKCWDATNSGITIVVGLACVLMWIQLALSFSWDRNLPKVPRKKISLKRFSGLPNYPVQGANCKTKWT